MTPEEKKLEAEADKLRAEAASLRRGGWGKPSSWVPLLAAIAAIGTSIGQYQAYSIQEKETAIKEKNEALDAREKVVTAKEEESLLKERNKQLEKRSSELTALISQYTIQMSQLKEEIKSGGKELLSLAEKKNLGQAALAELETTIAERAKKTDSIVDSAIKRNAEVELQNLVWQMNSDSKPERLAAVAKLIESYSADPVAIELSVELLTTPNLESLSSSGRINVLVFLRNTKTTAWTTKSLLGAESAIDEIRNRAEVGKAYIGPQTEEALDKLEQHLSQISRNK